MKFKETNFYNWHNTIDVQLHVHTCVIILCVYIYGISRHKNFVARKKMRFPFVVHSQGKWRKNRRKTGVCETVAKISWHVPIFMKVSAGVTRDSSLSSRSSFRNVPRLTYSFSPPLRDGISFNLLCYVDVFPRRPDASYAALSQGNRLSQKPIRSNRLPLRFAFSTYPSFSSSSSSSFFFFRLRKIKILFSPQDLICHFDEFTFNVPRET